MLPESTQSKRIAEVELFIEYAVGDDERETAQAVLRGYSENHNAVLILLEFYKVLPEAREEAVTRLAHIDARQGVHLIAVSTTNHDYVAVASENEAHILGEFGKDETPQEILNYFGHSSHDEFVQSCGKINELVELPKGSIEGVCPACGVVSGEFHLLGCPVEVCPWCDGQLNKCNCRFEKMDLETFSTEEELDDFQELLTEKGRIPYSPEQKPAYPGTSQGLDEKLAKKKGAGS